MSEGALPDPRWCARLRAVASPEGTRSVPARSERGADIGARPLGPDGHGERPAQPDRWVHVCELCGTKMYEHNCKIVCPNCGYKRDCTDP